MKENRNCIMKFRATKEEKAIIMEKVIDAGMNISEYLRRAALDKQVMNVAGLDDIASQLRAIGKNINQLTRAVNSGYIQAVDLHETEEVLSRLWQSLNSLRQDAR